MTESADVVIVGGGIIGCAIAHRLAHEKLSVIVVERSERGAEASSAAGGILSPQAEASEQDPFFDLCLSSRDLHAPLAAHLIEETGIDVEHSASGVLYVALEEDTLAILETRAAWQGRSGFRIARLDRLSATAIQPRLTEAVKGALHFPDDGHVNNVALTRALATAAEAHGVRFLERTEVAGLLRTGDRITGVSTARGKIASGWVVDAAGAWAGGIDDQLRERLPIRPVRGQMVALRSGAEGVGRVIYSENCYLVPRRDGRVVVGSTMEEAGYDKSTSAGAIQQLLDAAIGLMPELARCPVDSCWAGLRPASPDGWPVLGTDPQLSGLAYATGHFRNGILLAPITAEILGDLIVTGESRVELSPFRIERFFSDRRANPRFKA